MARKSWAMCWPKSRVVLVVLRSCVGVPLIVYGRITRQREKNHRKSDIKSDRVSCSAMCACQICSFLRFLFESAPKHLQVRMASVCVSSSTCAEAHGWANPSIFTFGKFVSQMTRYLSQLLRRVFVIHQCPLHARARISDFFEGKIISSSSVFHWGKKWLQISLPSLEYFKPQNHDDCFLWNNMIKSNVFMMIVFVWFCNVWVSYLMLLVVDTSLFRRFFTLCPHFHPYIYEGVKEESCTLRESAVEYLCEEHEWVPKIG